MRPVTNSTVIKEIIVVAFYCPPNSKKKSKLLDHILANVHILLTKYPNAGVIKNELNITSLISGIPRVKQTVSKCTQNENN